MVNNSNKLCPLAPNEDLSGDKYNNYKEYLDDALNDDSINNIAITGKYGSGKSSIINTYFKNKETDYLKVSFATFDTQKSDMGTNTTDTKNYIDSNIKKNIAANIINQIIYQIDSAKIPLTNFKVKREINENTKLLLIIETILILSLFSPKNIDTYFWEQFGSNLMYFFIIERALLLICITSVLIWNLLSRISPSKFKLIFKNIETEIDTTNDDLFEKHIDEIIYLFNKSDKHILIIEDLDRFNDLGIFEKLRELNTKLNSKKNKHWKFIYLIKDELFTNPTDRVKFFDIIIPVIPFITTNNSYYKLKKLFPENDERLLNILSVYIDDYRLLLNIRNEYTVFLPNSLESEQNERNELLALIAYKNLYPNKFDDLQNGKGELANTINKFRDTIDTQVAEIDEKINTVKQKKNETLANNEVDYLMLWSLKNNIQFQINGRINYSIPDLNTANTIIQQNINIFYNNHYMNYTKFKAENKEYSEGLRIAISFDSELENLKKQKNNLNSNRDSLYCIDKSFLEQKLSDILYVLIKNKFITENYLDVINNYYGDISNRKFLQSLLSYSNETQIGLELTHINDLMRILQRADFKKKQILNYDLLNYMFKNKKPYFKLMIQTANQEKIGFIEEALTRHPDYYDSIIKICPDIHFDLSKMSHYKTTNLDDIINNNRYNETGINFSIISAYIKNFSLQETLNIINNKKLYSSTRKSILQSDLPLVNLDELTDYTLWETALTSEKIKPTSKNVMDYFNKLDTQIDEFLTNFLNNQNIEFDSDLSDKFYNVLLSTANNNLKNDKFEEIIKQRKEKNITVELVQNQSKDKLQILLNNNMLEMNSSTIKFIVDHKLNVPSELIDDNFIQIIVDNKLDINIDILRNIVNTSNESRLLILSRNIELLETNNALMIIKEIQGNPPRIYNALIKRQGYKNYRFIDNESNRNIFTWAKGRELISEFSTEGSGKLSVK